MRIALGLCTVFFASTCIAAPAIERFQAPLDDALLPYGAVALDERVYFFEHVTGQQSSDDPALVSTGFDGSSREVILTVGEAQGILGNVLVADTQSRRIATARMRSNNLSVISLVTLNPVSFEIIEEVPAVVSHLSFSPDGRKLAYFSVQESRILGMNQTNPSGFTLHIYDFDQASSETISPPAYSEHARSPAAWAPSGRELVFAGNIDPALGYHLNILRPDGSEFRAIAGSEPYFVAQVAWVHENKVFFTQQGIPGLFQMNPRTGHLAMSPVVPGVIDIESVSPDRSHLLLSRLVIAGEPNERFVVTADGQELSQERARELIVDRAWRQTASAETTAGQPQ